MKQVVAGQKLMDPTDPSADEEAVRAETARARLLRITVDITRAFIEQGEMTRAEAEALVRKTRNRAMELFPDKADVFDLILAPRFARLIDEFCGETRGIVLPFPAPR